MQKAVFVLFIGLSLFLPESSTARAAEKVVAKVGTVAPEGTPWSLLLKRMKNRFKTLSEGKIKLKVYFGGRLGGEKEMVRETRRGRIQMFGGSTAALATIVPELYVLESPFLFESDEEADFVLDRHARPHVRTLLASKGFVFYQWAENGWHGLALKGGCVRQLSDLRAKKLRSQEARIHLDTFKAWGANPIEMSVPEVLPALKQGTVDGFSNTPLFAFATSWYQGVESYTLSNHIYQPGLIVYSKKWLDKQDKVLRSVLLGGVIKDEAFGRRGVRSIRKGLLENFTRAKISVCKTSPKLRKEMKAATASIFKKYRAEASPKGRALFDAIVEGKRMWAAKKQK